MYMVFFSIKSMTEIKTNASSHPTRAHNGRTLIYVIMSSFGETDTLSSSTQQGTKTTQLIAASSTVLSLTCRRLLLYCIWGFRQHYLPSPFYQWHNAEDNSTGNMSSKSSKRARRSDEGSNASSDGEYFSGEW